jgi:uncharacterized repeat protein (TIGR03803 family)
LTLATNGLISGTPTVPGIASFTVMVTDALSNTAIQALELTVITPPPQVATIALSNGVVGMAYSQQLSAISGQPPYSWSLFSGSLPLGLMLATNGLISGIPTNGGTNNFTVEVTDAANNTATQALQLTVVTPPQVATVKLPNGLTGVAYNQQLSAIFGQPPYSWSLFSGSLPSGLTLAANGLISGIPTVPGIASLTVMVTDAMSATGTMPLTLIISTSNSVSVFTPLYEFTALDPSYFLPQGALILSDNTLYGTASGDGNYNYGSVFALNTGGTGFTNLYSFTGGSDGKNPQCTLVLSGNTLYGTTHYGSTYNYGTVFALNINGTGFTNLYIFKGGSDGANPEAGLVLSGNILYGTADNGGTNGRGTVFALNTNGTFTTLHTFGKTYYNSYYGLYTNSDGENPSAGLLLSGNTLYGTTTGAGSYGSGTVFAINTNGTSFINLHSFGSDELSEASLILSGNTLYGTAYEGGAYVSGTVFTLNTNGTGFTTLHNFTATEVNGDNSDGKFPSCALVLSGNTLYGAAYEGGAYGSGTVFALNTNSTSFTNLYSFSSEYYNTSNNLITNNDGAGPGGLILSGNTLYGVTKSAGYSGNGIVFSLSLQALATFSNSIPIVLSLPQITVGTTNFTFLLSGPAGSNYVLQVSTNLLNWTPASTSAIPVSGTVNLTNAITNYNRRFYRVHLQ